MPNQKANEKKVKARKLESHFTAISVFEVAFSLELPQTSEDCANSVVGN